MNNGEYYSLATESGMVDITGGSVGNAPAKKRYSRNNGKNNKKKIVIISSIVAAVVVAAAVIFFCLFFGIWHNNGDSDDSASKEFLFAANTSVSGYDISGKTTAEAKELLEKNKTNFISPIRISIEVAGESIELTQDNFSYTYNIDEVLAQIKQDAESKNNSDGSVEKTEYSITATVTEDSITAKTDEICETYDTEPIDAYVSDFHPYEEERFGFVESIDGLKVDNEDLQSKIKEAFNNKQNYCVIEAEAEATEANVTVDFLRKNLVKLSSYETYSTNTANGTSNMKVSLEACNGSIIDPGEMWSFNECTGDSNLESNGYKPANVIANGKITQGIGGGLCQSSSTIYNAALRANMEIVERYNHQWASSYVPTGLDATIDYPNLDLTLRNVSGYQMFLECKLVDYTLYATFWGVQDASYDEIKTRNEMGSSDGSHYSVKAWRIYYKDGKKVKEEELSSSRYDSSHGLTFIAADNDTHDEIKDVDDLVETKPQQTSEQVSSSEQTSQSSQSQSQQSSAASSKPSTSSKPSSSSASTTTPPKTDPPVTEAEQSSATQDDSQEHTVDNE